MTRTLAAVALMSLTLAACGPRRAKTIDPDERGRVEGTGIEARDMRAAASQMVVELLASPSVTQASAPPRIAVLPVKNRSRFLIDQEILTTLFTDQLVQQGVGKVRVLNRAISEEIVREREAKRMGTLEGGAERAIAGADFFLEGDVRSLSASTGSHQSDYVVIRFQLTDAESTDVVWSSSYEVKKEGSWGVVYQ